MKLYFAKVDWYDDYLDKRQIDQCFVFADSYSDVCDQINNHFNFISSIIIEEVNDDCGDTSVLFVPDDEKLIQEIRNVNIW